MNYVDGFVFAVPAANKERFRAMAQRIAEVFTDHGALRVVENWGDDVPTGEQTWFARAVDLQQGEIVCFSWIEWPSRAARDKGNQALAADPRMRTIPEDEKDIMDPKRMIFGGFAPLVDRRG
ncbi:DUF1428 domain-containing protein [Sphingomonas sp. DG1-23]|jgi:uncharacterized protein YbaA (DUF1428 family)|uniref:DUF1428 domain-containing protein n=1 Tax=Sphingomonas sp. DG1-23 TaxID=3068316 RepID=UPI00273E807D|nr:DUF1428 domain-containing protein [Sphingomonas sp. DG1-23]MDP5280547.1 DUF1428 domain-containing protein [Sphingomonas sp. DG1-23]